jgi:hypothetical protein
MPRQHENDPNMNRGEVHQISMKLGQLSQAVEFMTDMWKRQEESASAGRKALHEKFEHFRDDMGVQVAGLSLRVDRMVDTMTKIEPAVKKYEDEKLRQEGAMKLGKLIWGGVLAAAGMMGGAITWGLQHWLSTGKVP